MLLRIQSNETLSSYIARNVFMEAGGLSLSGLDRVWKSRVGHSAVVSVAGALGWLGCYGFNRLLHEHTYYPRYAIFKYDQDRSYSHRYYHSGGESFESNRFSAAFCPECVKDDVSKIGFSYWRRIAHPDIKVCAIHNVNLLRECPYCEKAFDWKGHDLDVMWRGCSGRHLSDAVSVKNESASNLRRSKIFHDGFLFDGVISIETSLLVLNERIHAERFVEEMCSDAVAQIKIRSDAILASAIQREKENNGGWLYDECSEYIWSCLPLLYQNFDEFINDLKRHKCTFRMPSTLWSTYRAGGGESAHYVEEDYQTGVGVWSCPYPSPLSKMPYRNDRFGRPKIYPCCNFPPPRRKGHQLSPEWVDNAPPGVPILERNEGHLSRRLFLPADAGAY